jgi:hypothetical protein
MKFLILLAALATVGFAAPTVEHYKSNDQVRVELTPDMSPNDAHVHVDINIFGSPGKKAPNADGCPGAGDSKCIPHMLSPSMVRSRTDFNKACSWSKLCCIGLSCHLSGQSGYCFPRDTATQ